MRSLLPGVSVLGILLLGAGAAGPFPAAAAASSAWDQGEAVAVEEDPRSLVDRDYLRRSAEQFGKGSLARFKKELARINLTPAKLMIGLGTVGVFFTWNKNKRKPHWAVLFTVFMVLLLAGIAATYWRWHPLA